MTQKPTGIEIDATTARSLPAVPPEQVPAALPPVPQPAPEMLAAQPQPQAPVPLSQSDALLAMIERAGRDQTVDINKMERLFEMHKEAEAQRAKKATARPAVAAATARSPQSRRRSSPTYPPVRREAMKTWLDRRGTGSRYRHCQQKHADARPPQSYGPVRQVDPHDAVVT